MFKTTAASKPRTIMLFVVAGIALVMTYTLVTHWSDFMRGFHQGYAAAIGETGAAK